MPKTLGPHAGGPGRGRGFWAQKPIIIDVAFPFNQYDWPAPQINFPQVQNWTVNLLQSTLAPAPVTPPDTDHLPRAPHFTPLRAPVPFTYYTFPNFPIRFVMAQGPFSQSDWPNPIIAAQPLRLWSWSYNLNLIGQDRLPTGEQVYDLSPYGPRQPLRSWTWSYNLNLIGKDQLPAGEQSTDLPPRAALQLSKSWAQSLLQSTLSAAMPPGVRITDLSPRGYPAAGLTWAYSVNPNISPPPLPPDIFRRPPHFSNPRAPLPPGPSWTWWYNLSSVAPPVFPAGEQITDLPPRLYPPAGKTWVWSYNLNLIGKDQLPAGEQITDLAPVGPQYPIERRTWINKLNLSLTVAPFALPFNQEDWPTPRDYDRSNQLRTWIWSYNLRLIGQDRLPVGKQVTELPIRLTPTAVQTWISSVNLALTTQARPFNQNDWPNPQSARQPVRTWTSSYNLSLIGKDRLPVGKQIYELPPQGPLFATSLRTLVRHLNLALVVPPAPLPFNQKDWPNPRGYIYPQANRGFINVAPIAFIVPPPPVVLPRDPTHLRTRGAFEIDARGPESLDSRGPGSLDRRGPASLDRRGSDRFNRGRNQS